MRARRKAWAENLLCVLALFVIPFLLFAPCVLGFRIPLSVQQVLFMPPWEEARSAGLEIPSSADCGAAQYFPWYRFITNAASSGQSILWNPLEGFGTPFLAVWRTRALSPFSIPFYLLPLNVALWCSAVMKLVMAGGCAYYAARRFGLRPAMAFFLGLTFQVSAPVYLCSAAPMSDVTPWLPLLVVFAERLSLGQIQFWPMGAIVLALMTLGGDPETLTAGILFVLLFIVMRRVRDRRRVYFSAAVAGLLLALVFGLSMTAVQLAPYLEFLTQGKVHPPTARDTVELADLVSVFAPEPGGPERGGLFYAGAASVLLTALWMSLRRLVSSALRRRTESLVVAAMAMILLALFAGYASGHYPWFARWDGRHFLIIHAFALAFMAAAAIEEWNELDPEECRAVLTRLMLWVPLVWGLAFAGAAAALRYRGMSVGGVIFQLLAPTGAALAIAAFLGWTLLHPNARLLGYGLALVTLGVAWWTFLGSCPSTPVGQAFPNTPFITSLLHVDDRIAGSAALRRWPLAGNGIPQVFNPAGISLDRYETFIGRLTSEPHLTRRMGTQALLLTKEDIQGPFASIRPALTIEQVFPTGAVLFRDLEARPRARMNYRGRAVDALDPEQISAASPPLLEGAYLPAEDDGPVAEAAITAESHDTVTVHIAPTRPGVLVLCDAWYPGWIATVNGKAEEVLPVNGIFRGVEVGEGEHTVVFRYEPWPLRIGTHISFGAAICVFLGMRPWTLLRLGRSR